MSKAISHSFCSLWRQYTQSIKQYYFSRNFLSFIPFLFFLFLLHFFPISRYCVVMNVFKIDRDFKLLYKIGIILILKTNRKQILKIFIVPIRTMSISLCLAELVCLVSLRVCMSTAVMTQFVLDWKIAKIIFSSRGMQNRLIKVSIN